MSRSTRLTSRLRAPLQAAALALLAACLPMRAMAANPDANQPITLAADTVTVNNATGISIYQGHVVLTQGSLVIQGDRIMVKQDADNAFEHGTVWGNPAHFRQKRPGSDEYVKGYASRIEYNAQTGLAQLFGHAILTRGKDEVQGSYISYNSQTQFFQVIGGVTRGVGQTGGRVHAVIQPKKNPPPANAPAGASPAPAAASGQP